MIEEYLLWKTDPGSTIEQSAKDAAKAYYRRNRQRATVVILRPGVGLTKLPPGMVVVEDSRMQVGHCGVCKPITSPN